MGKEELVAFGTLSCCVSDFGLLGVDAEGRPAACVDREHLSCCLPGMTQRVRNACMCPGD